MSPAIGAECLQVVRRTIHPSPSICTTAAPSQLDRRRLDLPDGRGHMVSPAPPLWPTYKSPLGHRFVASLLHPQSSRIHATGQRWPAAARWWLRERAASGGHPAVHPGRRTGDLVIGRPAARLDRRPPVYPCPGFGPRAHLMAGARRAGSRATQRVNGPPTTIIGPERAGKLGLTPGRGESSAASCGRTPARRTRRRRAGRAAGSSWASRTARYACGSRPPTHHGRIRLSS
jgi:hypothetical protein